MLRAAVQNKHAVKVNPSIKRNKLILEFAPLIKYIANKIAAKLPSQIDINEIINTGVLGLIDAYERFNPEKGVNFRTYAEYRIKGAIIDSLRAMDWVPRSVRRIANLIEHTHEDLQKNLGRPPKAEEVASYLEIDMERFYKLADKVKKVNVVSIDNDFNNKDKRHSLVEKIACAENHTPCYRLDTEEFTNVLSRNIDLLPENEKKIIYLYYYCELTMKQIAIRLKITESRVSQIHSKAVVRLRGRLRRTYFN